MFIILLFVEAIASLIRLRPNYYFQRLESLLLGSLASLFFFLIILLCPKALSEGVMSSHVQLIHKICNQ
jgi:hypothetical protein